MNKETKFRNLKYYKPGKSYSRLKELERVSRDPFRISLLPWVDDAEVKVGIHQDKNNPSPTEWIGWVLLGDDVMDVKNFNSKNEAHDWVIAKGLRYLRKKKIKNQLALYGFLLAILMFILFSLYMLTEVFPVL